MTHGQQNIKFKNTVYSSYRCEKLARRDRKRFNQQKNGFTLALRPKAGYGSLIHEVSRSQTTTHDSRLDSLRRAICSKQRPLPDNILNSQQTYPCPRRDWNPHYQQAREAADQRLRPSGHWHRHYTKITAS
jgi:hypothetical protein